MKYIFLFATTLISSAAYACPDLSGAYTCKYEDGYEEQVTLSQRVDAGTTFIAYNGTEYATDGREYAMEESDRIRNGRFNLTCDATALLIDIKATFLDGNGDEFGDYTGTSRYSIDSGNLKVETVGKVVSLDGTEYPGQDTYTCTRN